MNKYLKRTLSLCSCFRLRFVVWKLYLTVHELRLILFSSNSILFFLLFFYYIYLNDFR